MDVLHYTELVMWTPYRIQAGSGEPQSSEMPSGNQAGRLLPTKIAQRTALCQMAYIQASDQHIMPMRSVGPLGEKAWAELERIMDMPPTKKQLEILEEARRIPESS